jgi:eukaryotic-like serine/threonine-protein kinase
MSSFPAAGDYYKAVQAPSRVFTVPKLQRAEFVWDSLGPTLARGSSAVVFQAAVDGSPQALRCYIRNDASSRDRYSALDAYLVDRHLNPYVSGTTWLDSAIRVNGETWPVLQMSWIDGRTLNEYVDFLVTGSNAAALATLAARWREMVARLQNSEFAHGDLQHGNVLVDQEGILRLVDFDGVWIPQLASHAPPTEYGHPNYQHPGRHEWDRWLDTFSALVIYLSLIALSKDPALWLALYNSKNLLFSKGDFFAPFETEAWKQLAALHDPQVDDLTRRLQECCAPGWVSNQSLEATLDQRPAGPLGPLGPLAPAPLPVTVQLPWWEKQSASGASAAAPLATPRDPAWPWTQPPPPGAQPSQPAPAQPSQPSQPAPAQPPASAPAPVAPTPTTRATPAGSVSSAASAQAAAESLPAPPPLSAPLGLAGTGPIPQLRQTMAPPGATWWTGPGSGPAPGPARLPGSQPRPAPYGPAPHGPAQPGPAQQGPAQPGGPPRGPAQPGPMPPASTPSAPVAKLSQNPAIGIISLGLGILLLIAGAAAHLPVLVIIGLIGGAWGMWRVVSLSGNNTKPPGAS